MGMNEMKILPYDKNDMTTSLPPSFMNGMLIAQAYTHPGFYVGLGSSEPSDQDIFNVIKNKPVNFIFGRYNVSHYWSNSQGMYGGHAKLKENNIKYTEENVKTKLGWKKQF